MPQGSLQSVLDRYATQEIVVRRFSDGAWSKLAAQKVFIDFSPSGGVLSLGAGLTGQANVTPIYLTPDNDLAIDDAFGWEGSLYRVVYVGVPGTGPSGSSVRMAFATTQRAAGEAT